MTSENHTNATVASLDLSAVTWVIPFFCTLAVVGILSNIYLIVHIYRRQTLRNAPTYVALTCLALADAIHLVILVCAGICEDYTKTRTLCQILTFGFYFTTGTSSYHVVIFSVLRYVILIKPFFAMKYVTLKNTLCCSLICWLVFLCVAGLAFLTADSGSVDTSDGKVLNLCVTVDDGKYIELIVLIIVFYIPLIFISGFHVLKCVLLKGRSVDTANTPTQKQHVSTAIVVTIIILFVICYFPMSVYMTITLIFEIQVASNVHFLGYLFMGLTPINSALNPFVHFFFTRCLRKGVRRQVDTNVQTTSSEQNCDCSLTSPVH